MALIKYILEEDPTRFIEIDNDMESDDFMGEFLKSVNKELKVKDSYISDYGEGFILIYNEEIEESFTFILQ